MSPLMIVSLDQGKIYGQKPSVDELHRRLMATGLAQGGSLLAEAMLVPGRAASRLFIALLSRFRETVTGFAHRLQPASSKERRRWIVRRSASPSEMTGRTKPALSGPFSI